jgi:hypothetical protein
MVAAAGPASTHDCLATVGMTGVAVSVIAVRSRETARAGLLGVSVETEIGSPVAVVAAAVVPGAVTASVARATPKAVARSVASSGVPDVIRVPARAGTTRGAIRAGMMREDARGVTGRTASEDRSERRPEDVATAVDIVVETTEAARLRGGQGRATAVSGVMGSGRNTAAVLATPEEDVPTKAVRGGGREPANAAARIPGGMPIRPGAERMAAGTIAAEATAAGTLVGTTAAGPTGARHPMGGGLSGRVVRMPARSGTASSRGACGLGTTIRSCRSGSSRSTSSVPRASSSRP